MRAIRTILTEKQFKVTTATRGEEGLALAAATEPDLIILDLGLPDMDGGQLTIDLAWHIVKLGEEEVKLTGTEHKLLAYLATNHGRVLTHQSILMNVWGQPTPITPNTYAFTCASCVRN